MIIKTAFGDWSYILSGLMWPGFSTQKGTTNMSFENRKAITPLHKKSSFFDVFLPELTTSTQQKILLKPVNDESNFTNSFVGKSKILNC